METVNKPSRCTTDGKVFDPTIESSGQQRNYIVLSEDERAKCLVRPVRRTYVHAGERPEFPVRDLTQAELERYASEGYVKYESYPEERYPAIGRYWTLEDLNSGCGAATTMGLQIAETYARNPSFYGSTFCYRCGKHLPVEQFVWEDGSRLGS